jgi:hypothetical protein
MDACGGALVLAPLFFGLGIVLAAGAVRNALFLRPLAIAAWGVIGPVDRPMTLSSLIVVGLVSLVFPVVKMIGDNRGSAGTGLGSNSGFCHRRCAAAA